jgi:hypothetical protein
MNETVTFEFPHYMAEEFETTLEKVNKKLRRIKGTTDITVLEQNEYRKEVDNYKFVEFIKTTVSLPVSVKHRGFEYVGTVSTKDGVQTIFAPNNDNIADVNTQYCDHCNTNRKRNVVHVFNHEKKGRTTVGSTCCKEFFGLDLHKALNIFKGFLTLCLDMDYDEEQYCASRSTYGFFRQAVYAATLLAYNENNSYSKGDYYNGIPSTADFVKDMLNDNGFHRDIKRNARNSAEVIPFKDLDELLVATYGNLDPKASNFNSNVANALFCQGILREFIPFKAVGLIVWAIYNALNKKAKAENTAKKVNAHIGNVGEKIVANDATLRFVKEMGSFSYYGPTSYLLTFDTPNGQVKTFSTNKTLTGLEIGATVNLTGKVKSHEEYKGFKSTMLNYTKVVV